MQLVSNDSQQEDASENEPILRQSDILRSVDSSFSSEIITVGGDHVVTDEDLEDVHADESSRLVNLEQPQCRICLDNAGTYILQRVVFYFSFLIFNFVVTI